MNTIIVTFLDSSKNSIPERSDNQFLIDEYFKTLISNNTPKEIITIICQKYIDNELEKDFSYSQIKDNYTQIEDEFLTKKLQKKKENIRDKIIAVVPTFKALDTHKQSNRTDLEVIASDIEQITMSIRKEINPEKYFEKIYETLFPEKNTFYLIWFNQCASNVNSYLNKIKELSQLYYFYNLFDEKYTDFFCISPELAKNFYSIVKKNDPYGICESDIIKKNLQDSPELQTQIGNINTKYGLNEETQLFNKEKIKELSQGNETTHEIKFIQEIENIKLKFFMQEKGKYLDSIIPNDKKLFATKIFNKVISFENIIKFLNECCMDYETFKFYSSIIIDESSFLQKGPYLFPFTKKLFYYHNQPGKNKDEKIRVQFNNINKNKTELNNIIKYSAIELAYTYYPDTCHQFSQISMNQLNHRAITLLEQIVYHTLFAELSSEASEFNVVDEYEENGTVKMEAYHIKNSEYKKPSEEKGDLLKPFLNLLEIADVKSDIKIRNFGEYRELAIPLSQEEKNKKIKEVKDDVVLPLGEKNKMINNINDYLAPKQADKTSSNDAFTQIIIS